MYGSTRCLYPQDFSRCVMKFFCSVVAEQHTALMLAAEAVTRQRQQQIEEEGAVMAVVAGSIRGSNGSGGR